MKPSRSRFTPFTVAALALAGSICSQALAQTASTTPVGFITLSVPGTSTLSPAGSGALTLAGLGMVQPITFQGNADVVNTGTSTITNNSATWTANQFAATSNPYFLEIASGPAAGVILDIASNTSTTVTTTQALPAAFVANASFIIRPHWTLSSVFGATGNAGLAIGNTSSADQVLLYNGNTYDAYYYDNGQGFVSPGWQKNNNPIDGTTVRIYPDQGILIIRRQSASTQVVLTGAVKTGQTSVPIQSGNNVVGNVYGAGMTLADSGLYTGNSATGVASGTSTSADQVLIYNTTSSTYSAYYYDNGAGFFPAGWTSASGVASGTVAIPVGSSIIVQRKIASAFNWVIPQHPTSF